MTYSVNLLPWELRRRQLMRRQFVRWSGVLALLICFVGAVRFQKDRAWNELRDTVSAMDARATPLRNLASRNQQQQAELASLLHREQLLKQLGAPFEPLQLITVLSGRTNVRGGGVRILDLKVTTLEAQAKRQASAPVSARARRQRPQPVVVADEATPDNKTEVSIYGLAKNDLALSEFVTSLRHAGVFESIELKSTDEVAHPSGLTREYRVRCVL